MLKDLLPELRKYVRTQDERYNFLTHHLQQAFMFLSAQTHSLMPILADAFTQTGNTLQNVMVNANTGDDYCIAQGYGPVGQYLRHHMELCSAMTTQTAPDADVVCLGFPSQVMLKEFNELFCLPVQEIPKDNPESQALHTTMQAITMLARTTDFLQTLSQLNLVTDLGSCYDNLNFGIMAKINETGFYSFHYSGSKNIYLAIRTQVQNTDVVCLLKLNNGSYCDYGVYYYHPGEGYWLLHNKGPGFYIPGVYEAILEGVPTFFAEQGIVIEKEATQDAIWEQLMSLKTKLANVHMAMKDAEEEERENFLNWFNEKYPQAKMTYEPSVKRENNYSTLPLLGYSHNGQTFSAADPLNCLNYVCRDLNHWNKDIISRFSPLVKLNEDGSRPALFDQYNAHLTEAMLPSLLYNMKQFEAHLDLFQNHYHSYDDGGQKAS